MFRSYASKDHKTNLASIDAGLVKKMKNQKNFDFLIFCF